MQRFENVEPAWARYLEGNSTEGEVRALREIYHLLSLGCDGQIWYHQVDFLCWWKWRGKIITTAGLKCSDEIKPSPHLFCLPGRPWIDWEFFFSLPFERCATSRHATPSWRAKWFEIFGQLARPMQCMRAHHAWTVCTVCTAWAHRFCFCKINSAICKKSVLIVPVSAVYAVLNFMHNDCMHLLIGSSRVPVFACPTQNRLYTYTCVARNTKIGVAEMSNCQKNHSNGVYFDVAVLHWMQHNWFSQKKFCPDCTHVSSTYMRNFQHTFLVSSFSGLFSRILVDNIPNF